MPDWAKRITTIGQVVIVLIAVGAVVLLALEHIIDGAAALGALVLITGVGGTVPALIHHTSPSPAETTHTVSDEASRG